MRSKLKKARSQRPHHAKFAPKSRERNARFSEFRRAARTKFACTRPACVLKIAECRCSCSPSLKFVHIGKCARPAFEITQILRQTRAKELQIFQNFSATSTQKCVHSASVRCANSRTLLRPFNEAAVRSDPKRHAPDVEGRLNNRWVRFSVFYSMPFSFYFCSFLHVASVDHTLIYTAP